jgi:adenosylmethionine-8-amino-7-oxononanoate aminotransferase
VNRSGIGPSLRARGGLWLAHMGATATATDHLLLHFARNGGARDGEIELLMIERGEGVFLIDSQGRRHLDGLSNLFCAQLGYGYGAEMAEVASRQLTELPFATNWGVAHPTAVELAVRLAEISPGDLDHVYFTNGGSESVEAAWKLVRQFHIGNGEPERTKAIARDRAYHGVTLGALSFTGVPGFKEPFGAAAVETFHVSNTNDFRRPESGSELTQILLDEVNGVIEREGAETIAMIIAEPVQNAGGCLQPPDGYWAGLREICDRHGILLLADEVITGFGRLGEWFAVDRFGAVPDLITTAKGLTSAYAPMGAVLASARVVAPLYDQGRTLLHGITFGGHPLSAAIALKNLEIFDRERVLDNVRELESYLAIQLDTLRRLPIVGDVRGSGFFWAVELVPDGPDSRFDAPQREELLRRCLPGALIHAELIARGDDRGDTVVQIAPPLICDRAILDDLVGRLGEVLTILSEHMGIPTA